MKQRPRPKGSVIAALDIGSSKIACFIARVVDDEGRFQILGIGHQAAVGMRLCTGPTDSAIFEWNTGTSRVLL